VKSETAHNKQTMTKAKALQSVFPGLSGKPNPQYINVSKTIMRASIMRKNELKIPLKKHALARKLL